jgi:hypothetical protein
MSGEIARLRESRDSKVPRDPKTRVTVLARPSSNLPDSQPTISGHLQLVHTENFVTELPTWRLQS